jgi:hypothetical protein
MLDRASFDFGQQIFEMAPPVSRSSRRDTRERWLTEDRSIWPRIRDAVPGLLAQISSMAFMTSPTSTSRTGTAPKMG